MGDKPSHGQRGADSDAGDGDDRAHDDGNPAELLTAIRTLTDKVAALEASVPKIVNKAVTSHLKRQKPPPPAGDDQGGDGEDDQHDEPQRGADNGDRGRAPAQKPAKDPEVARLRQQLAEMQRANAEAAAKAADAKRQNGVRSAIAASGHDLTDSEDAYRVLLPDLEPDEDNPEQMRPRDPAHQGKSLAEYVKARLAEKKYLHKPTGRASGDRTGDSKPDAGGFREDPNLSPEANIAKWRREKAAAAKVG